MRKIPTLFERTYENHKVVGITDKLTADGLQVVLDGKTFPTIKTDGSCCAVINGRWYKRFDAKKGKKIPEGAIPCQSEPDEITGHWPHWVELNAEKAEDKWFIEAFKNYFSLLKDTDGKFVNKNIPDGTYEAIGLHFQGNPYNLKIDTLYEHGSDIIYDLKDKPLTLEILKEYLTTHIMEGIVFWYKGNPICKIKRSDFGLEWPVKKEINMDNNISKQRVDQILASAKCWVDDTVDLIRDGYTEDEVIEAVKTLFKEESK